MPADDDIPDVTATAPAGPSPAPPTNPGAPLDLAELLPSCSPAAFELGEEVGRGGIGRVLRARDPVFDRPIAIKELHSTSSVARARFLREAMITARLQHPSIVPVYLAGRWPDGSPFYGMKLVEGKPLSEALAERTTLRARMELLPAVIATCEAIAYAHRHRVVHRDLKPSNVLLGELGETVVIDWGLAKDLDESEDPVGAYGAVATASETIAGAVLGTPAYMPPEQGAGKEVDERGDVYSLGAMLYEVLAGARPYAASKTPREILETLAEHGPAPLGEVSPETARDLVAIVERAMAREAVRRYPNAGALAEDLRRFQTGQLVSVREYGWIERAARWMRKHRTAVIVAAAALVVLIVVAVVGFVSTVRAQHRAEAAARAEATQRANAEAQRDEAVLANAQAIVRDDPAAAVVWLAKLSAESPLWTAASTIAADAYAARIPALFPEPGFRVEWMALSKDDRTLFVGQSAGRLAVVYDVATRTAKRIEAPMGQLPTLPSRDGRMLPMVGNAVTLMRVEDGTVTRFDTGGAKTTSARFSPNGAWLGAIAGSTVFVWPSAGGAGRAIETPAAQILVELDDQGTLYGLDRERTAVWIYPPEGPMRKVPIPADAGAGRATRNGEEVAVELAKFGTATSVIVSTGAGKLGVIDASSGAFEMLPTDDVYSASLANEDMTSIVAVKNDVMVRWERGARGWRRVEEIRSSAGAMALVGTSLLGGSGDGPWVIRDGARVVGRFRGVPHPAKLSSDGKRLFGVTTNGMVAQWDLADGDGAICGREPVIGVAPDRFLVQVGNAKTLRLCDPRDGTQRVFAGGTQLIEDIRFSRSATFMVTRGASGEIVVWNVAAGTGSVLDTRGIPIAITDDGKSIVVNDGGRVFVVDVATGARKERCAALAGKQPSAISIAGDILVQASRERLKVCEIEHDAIRTLDGYPGEPFDDSLQFDRSLVYMSGLAGPVLWDLRSNRRYSLDLGTQDRVGAMELLPDDKGVVVAGQRFAAIFDDKGHLVHQIARTATIAASGVTASSDLRRIVTTDFVEHGRLYDLDSKRSRVLGGGGNGWHPYFFDHDRVIVITGYRDRPFRFSDVRPGSVEELRARVLKTAASVTLDTEGRSTPAK